MDGSYLPEKALQMGKSSAFFLWMLALTICAFFIDWLKATYFLHTFHSFFVVLKTLIWPLGGILIMKFYVSKKGFRLFLLVYLSLWAGYFLIKFIFFLLIKFHLAQVTNRDSFNFLLGYMYFTKLLTPIPFIFLWLVDRIFYTEQKKQSI